MKKKSLSTCIASCLSFFTIGFLAMLCLELHAGDLSRDVRSGTSDTQGDSANYLELGLGLGVYESPFYGIPEGNKRGKITTELKLDINMYYQYHGWFAEGFSQSLEQLTFGYHFVESNKFSLDVIGLQEDPEISENESRDLKGLKKRSEDFMMGFRATAYLDNYIVQAHAISDVTGVHNGQVYSLKAARHWQYRNWNFHAIYGVSYRSESISDYYFSVKPEDANEKFPAYHAHAGYLQLSEVGVTYPINEKWVFRGLLRYVTLDPSWSRSPLIVSNNGKVFLSSISYVF